MVAQGEEVRPGSRPLDGDPATDLRLAAQAVGSAGLLEFESLAGRSLVVVGFGMSGGLFGLVMTVIWPRFYGRLHLGAITSANMTMTVIGSAFGPRIFAFYEARDGQYDGSLLLGAVSALVLMIATIGVGNPQRRPAKS